MSARRVRSFSQQLTPPHSVFFFVNELADSRPPIAVWIATSALCLVIEMREESEQRAPALQIGRGWTAANQCDVDANEGTQECEGGGTAGVMLLHNVLQGVVDCSGGCRRTRDLQREAATSREEHDLLLLHLHGGVQEAQHLRARFGCGLQDVERKSTAAARASDWHRRDDANRSQISLCPSSLALLSTPLWILCALNVCRKSVYISLRAAAVSRRQRCLRMPLARRRRRTRTQRHGSLCLDHSAKSPSPAGAS